MIETCFNSIQTVKPYEDLAKDTASFIHEHLTTLYFITKEFDCKSIVEIGTGKGHSTLALACAAYSIGGQVRTIDIARCLDAEKLLKDHSLDFWVKFINEDSCSYVLKCPKLRIDHLFIDGDHSYGKVYDELMLYYGKINDGGFITLHDIANPEHTGVYEAVHDFLENHGNRSYTWYNNNGLMVIRK